MKIPLLDLTSQYKNIKKEIDRSVFGFLSSGQYIKGPKLTEFEKKFAKYCGTKYAVGVASGTDALKLSLAALNLKAGDEVLVPANTFVGAAYAVIACGATVVLVDVLEDSLSMDVAKVKEVITKVTRAIAPVHLYGFPAEMDKIKKLAKTYNLKILEDAAQAHGAEFRGKKVGNLSDVSAFSFFPGKNLGAYGDGGGLTTNSKAIYEKLLSLREYGGAKYIYSEVGTNSRLDEIQAAVLLVKLKYLTKWNRQRQKAAAYYSRLLSKSVPQVTPVIPNNNSSPVYHLYVIRTKKRDKLANYMDRYGIQTGVHYPVPLHLQKSLAFLGYKKGDFPVAEAAAKEILSLPIYPEITKAQQDRVVDTIRKFFDQTSP